MIDFVTDSNFPHVGGNIRHGDHNGITPALWQALVYRYSINSMLDVGCGEGHASSFFHKIGVIAHGIDGLELNIRRSVYPIAFHDLTLGPYVMPVDLVLSIEVAEHVEDKYVDHYIETLCNGNVVVMTHALPQDDDGYHHVNCQYADYWVDKLSSRGYRLDYYNDFWKDLARSERSDAFFAKTGLIFVRKD